MFSAHRLTVARERRALTKKALAEAVGVSAQCITGAEICIDKLSDRVITAIAQHLEFPKEFFFAPDGTSLEKTKAISFRHRRSLTMEARRKALATGELATGVISPEMRRRFCLPDLDLPDLAGETPETAAKIMREHWKLGFGPIHNMVHLLEAKGIEVYWMHEPIDALDAVSFWRDDLPFVMLNTHKEAGERARYDAAHELGHLVLHRRQTVVEGTAIESEADAFASAFLLPAEQFRYESPQTPNLKLYMGLKQRWAVSIAAMVRRGKDLNVFSPDLYEASMKHLSTLGWRREEPFKLPRERSMLHQLAFDRLAEKNMSPIDFAQHIRLNVRDVLEIMPTTKEMMPIQGVISETEYGDFTLRLVE